MLIGNVVPIMMFRHMEMLMGADTLSQLNNVVHLHLHLLPFQKVMELLVPTVVNVRRVLVVVATVVIIKADPLDAQIATVMVIVADVVQIIIGRRTTVTLVLVAKQVHLDLLRHHNVPRQKKAMVLFVPMVVNAVLVYANLDGK